MKIDQIEVYHASMPLKGQVGSFSASSANLSDLMIVLNKAMEGLDSATLVVDSVSSFALDAGEDTSLKCLRMLIPRIRMKRCLGLFTISEGVYSPAFLNAARTTSDGIIEMKIEEIPNGIERLVRIFAARSASPIGGGWTKFHVTDKCVVIGNPMFMLKVGMGHLAKGITGKAHAPRVDEGIEVASSS